MRPTIDEWALEVLQSYAKRGTCNRRQAGALALDKYNRIIGLGMNGVPRGYPHCTEWPCPGAQDPSGDTSRCMAIHAEVNMVMNAISSPTRIVKVYTTVTPCRNCALVLANLPNLGEVRSWEEYKDTTGWELLKSAGVDCQLV